MRIGIDMGGTKIEGIALDDNGRELLRRRVPTPLGDYQATLATVVGLVQDIESHAGQRGSVGVGTPGDCNFASDICKAKHDHGNQYSTNDISQRTGRPQLFSYCHW